LSQALRKNDPRDHTQKIERRLQETIDHLREEIKQVDEPGAKAMFETSAEVLGGLVNAFRDYEQKITTALQSRRPSPSGEGPRVP
jgi:rubrerythrin